MNIAQRIGLAWNLVLSGKASAAASVMTVGVLGRPVWTDRKFDKFAEEGYKKNVVAFQAINKVAGALAAIPFNLKQGDKELEAHPLLTLLRRPNPAQGGAAFFRAHTAYWLIAGNAYMEAVGPKDIQFAGDVNAAPRELYTLRPDRMKVVAGPAGIPGGFVYEHGGRTHAYDVDDVTGKGPIMHNKFFNPLNDWYGMSPIEAAAYAIDQHNSAGAWNQALLQNSARPPGAMVYQPKDGPATLSPSQFERLKEEMQRQYAGARNAGRPLLLDGGMDWKTMGFSPAEMDWINGKHVSAREIALAFGTPPQLLGIPGDNTYANAKEARQALYEDTVLPLLDLLLDDLNNWLVPQFGLDLALGYDIDEIPALAARREARWTAVSTANFLSKNEKREAVGYQRWEPSMVENPADELTQPAGELPLSMDVDAGKGEGEGGEGEEGAPKAPTLDADGKPMPATDNVQATALNGAQVASLQAIVQAVADGELPAEAAITLIMMANPAAKPESVRAMIAAAEAFAKTRPKPEPVSPAPGGMPSGGGKPPAVPAKPKPATREEADAANAKALESLGFEAADAAELTKALGELAYGDG